MQNYKRLNSKEREKIFLLLNQGLSIREIGRRLERDHGSISREVSSLPGRYSPAKAQAKSCEQRTKPRKKKLDEGVLRNYVVKKLGRHWSPEQIAGRLMAIHSQTTVSYETIYQFVYSKDGKKNRYFEFLRKAHKKRSLKHGRYSQKVKKVFIPNRAWIEARPPEAIKRLTVGHLEGDLMEGKRATGGAVSVTADRKSGLVLLDKLTSKNSLERMLPLVKRFSRYPSALHKTITFDNGTENVEHEILSKYTNCQTFFTHPYHSWEKGTVENTIGLVREFVPKGTDLKEVKQKDLNTIAMYLNDRPRKRLGFKTPSEVLSEETGWCITS